MSLLSAICKLNLFDSWSGENITFYGKSWQYVYISIVLVKENCADYKKSQGIIAQKLCKPWLYIIFMPPIIFCCFLVVREQLRGLSKDYDKSENDLKALQSVGQVFIVIFHKK